MGQASSPKKDCVCVFGLAMFSNKHKVFAILIQYRLGPLKIKNLRMTCGTLFLNARYGMGNVAQILGHRSQRTTELHYAAFLDKRIERAMA